MTPLRLLPTSLPEKETLVLVPQIRGVSGAAELLCRRTTNSLELKAQVQLGVLLFKNALNFEAGASWEQTKEVWHVKNYREINRKTGKEKNTNNGFSKAHEVFPKEAQVLDPLGFLYALRTSPTSDPTTSGGWVGYGARGENPIKVEIFAKERKEMKIEAFGSTPRQLLRIEMVIEAPQRASKVRAFNEEQRGGALWIDLQTKIPVEISYQIPPFGALSMKLQQIKT